MFPRVVDRVLRTPEVNARRALVCGGLHGRVLEIGFGSGLNLRHYPVSVTEILIVEPSAVALRLAQPRLAVVDAPVTQVGVAGASLALPDESVPAAHTYTLSPPEVTAALDEVHGSQTHGVRHFLAHGRAPTGPYSVAARLHPAHSRIAGGCNIERPIDDLISAAGLVIDELETGYGDGPRPLSYLYRGRASRHA